MATIGPEPVDDLGPTIRRYKQRRDERQRIKQSLREHGILATDSEDRVSKRLDRLHADWDVARRIERTSSKAMTGRSLREVRADDFDADHLGLERLLGRNDLIDVGFLQRGHFAARSIGRITIRAEGRKPPEFGTGFLVSPRLLLTNHHVLEDVDKAKRGFVEFNVQSGPNRLPMTPCCFELDPDTCFVSHEGLDFTFVAVRAPSGKGEVLEPFAWLPLIEQEGKVLLGERVNIIQHPNGEPKQIGLRGNEVVDILDEFIHYETDTEQGSSGAPVLNDQFELIALHHRGVPKMRGDDWLTVDGQVWTKGMDPLLLDWDANEGVRISRVIKELRRRRLTGTAKDLRKEALEIGPPDPLRLTQESARAATEEVTRVTVPLSVTITVGRPATT